MKNLKTELENQVMQSLMSDPKIKEFQEEQRVNAIKAKYFDILYSSIENRIDELILYGCDSPASSKFSEFCTLTLFSSVFSDCYSEIGEHN